MQTMTDCTMYQKLRAHKNSGILFDAVHWSIFSQQEAHGDADKPVRRA